MRRCKAHTGCVQTILLASLLLMVKHKASKEVKLGKLMDTFKKVMSKRRMQIDASVIIS